MISNEHSDTAGTSLLIVALPFVAMNLRDAPVSTATSLTECDDEWMMGISEDGEFRQVLVIEAVAVP